jgi:hypothetical protein
MFFTIINLDTTTLLYPLINILRRQNMFSLIFFCSRELEIVVQRPKKSLFIVVHFVLHQIIFYDQCITKQKMVL